MQLIYDMLGPKRASAMLGFHVFTKSDICGRFAGRTKEWCFNVFMSCDDEILEVLASLGNIDPSPETCTQLEGFVCMRYRSKVCTKVKELRWFLYSNRAAEGESLPPTTCSLTLRILRAHYIAMRKAGDSHLCLPYPECGWNFNAAVCHLVFVLCLNPPAPEAIMKSGVDVNVGARASAVVLLTIFRALRYVTAYDLAAST